MSGTIDIKTILQTSLPVGPTGPMGTVTPELQTLADNTQTNAQKAQTFTNLILMGI